MASYLKDILDPEKLPSLNTWAPKSGNGAVTSRKTAAWSGDDIFGNRTSVTNGGLYGADTLATTLKPRPPSPTQTRRNILELQDQLKSYKDEVAKKDALIQQLTSLEASTVPAFAGSRTYDHLMQIDPLVSIDRQNLETARTELASLQVKNEKLQVQVKECENALEEKEVRIRELQNQKENLRGTENTYFATIQSLKQTIQDLESKATQFESVAGRGEIAISTFQKENRAQQEKIIDLESRLRKQLDEREQAETKAVNYQKKFQDLVAKITSLLRTEDLTSEQTVPENLEVLYVKISDVFQENAMLRGKLVTLNEMLSNSEMESKASRETIMRLVSEVSREQKVTSHSSFELNNLRLERDNAIEQRKDQEREINHLKERLMMCQKALDSSQNELKMRESHISAMDREVRESGHNIKTAHTQLNLFREQLASILSDAYHMIEANDEDIKERCKYLMMKYKEQTHQLEINDKHIHKLLSQLENQHGLQQEAMEKAKLADLRCSDLEEHLRVTEGELATGDILRSGFKSDKEKYLRCLERLAQIMKVDNISGDIGLDSTIDALTARAEQLIKLEASSLVERSAQVYSQQRKMKTLKEQLQSKELHLDLLRKKITSLEERVHGKTDVEKERDTESMKVRKMEKVVEKYKLQLKDARADITELKARLLEASDLKVCTLEQKTNIENLEKKIEELEKIRFRQAHKISEVEDKCKLQEIERKEKGSASNNAVHALSSELKTTKMALSAIADREKQLIDFRNVISRMLGLDINTLAIPDYEIISRLEKLIQAHHVTSISTLGLEEAMAGMEDGFVNGYQEAQQLQRARVNQSLPASYVRKTRDYTANSKRQSRARSASPGQIRVDPRSY